MSRISDPKRIKSKFGLHPGEKFTCIVLYNIAVADSLSSLLDLGNGIWVSDQSPFGLDPRWREWVGKLRSEEIDDANLFLIARMESEKPQILDEENNVLWHQVSLLLWGILLQGIPDSVNGSVITGANVSGETEIRSMGPLSRFYHSSPPERVIIDDNKCHKAKDFVDGFRKIEASSDWNVSSVV